MDGVVKGASMARDELHIPSTVPNIIGGVQTPARSGDAFEKKDPHTGKTLCRVARSDERDVRAAVDVAAAAQGGWAATTPVRRGAILYDVVAGMEKEKRQIAGIVAAETGKSPKDALGETEGAIALGRFFAGEGQRLYGRTTTSGAENRWAMTIRQPIGVAGLIVAANTPIANAAWKVFPALVCGNGAVLKAAEDTPATAWVFGKVAHEAGLPPGVFNVVQGLGEEAGAALVANHDVGVVSFTGSTEVGRIIAQAAGARLARLSLELGGKNPLVVADDADLDNALRWVLLSAFSNAGQRCAAAGRVIIFDAVYDRFKSMLVKETQRLRVGPTDDDFFGPVINEEQLTNMLGALKRAREQGAVVLVGGDRLTDAAHAAGFYLAPTLVENVGPDAEISQKELFGPIACLYRVRDFAQALAAANDSPYGLTASIHTTSFHRAVEFVHKVKAGVALVNAGTYGSEPHMPFGGVKQSGNGSREPGTEALDVYSELKDVYLTVDPRLT
jgi:acyl-CoA reductase-like NAD-dependent aldehyde dehydrogenase